jgi:predicted DNA-binding transcriptional regulator AlpA
VKTGKEQRLSLDEIAVSPLRANDLSPEEAREILMKLTVVLAAVGPRLLQPAVPGSQAPTVDTRPRDRLLKVPEAAAKLGITPGSLYNKARDYPFVVRDGRSLRFSELGIDEWIARSRLG